MVEFKFDNVYQRYKVKPASSAATSLSTWLRVELSIIPERITLPQKSDFADENAAPPCFVKDSQDLCGTATRQR
ncbi:MAG: hypothetical protein M3R14_01515 [Acidobacteriota bacterium]|nr:hypothetical protein [Acidobacteriota bacterium]